MERDFWKKYKSKGLQVVGVNSFEDEKPLERAKLFAQEHKLTYPLLVDTGDKIATAFGFSGLPSQAVIDRKGIVQYRDEGDFNAEKLKATIEKLLAGK